jgi:hypothetical protein
MLFKSSLVLTRREWFKLQPSFRTDQFLVRNDTGEPLRTIYLSNPVIKVSTLSSEGYS